MGVRRLLTITALCAALTGCALFEPRACTMIGTSVGVSMDIKAPLAARVAHAEVEVCWSGRCRTSKAMVNQGSRTVEETCSGDTCSARAEPTADKWGFADVADLPKSPVELRVILRDGKNAQILSVKGTVTPKGQFPNGPDCGEGGPQAGVTIEGDGTMRERP